jgi:hypothetical protein
MKLQALIPAVEHAEETDLGSKMPWIASDLKQGLSAGVKEQVVDEPLVLQRERGQFPRQSEDGMDIASGQQFPFARLEPAPARVALASGNACFCTSCRRSWSYVRSRCSGRDARPARRCGSARWPAAPSGVAS